MADKRRMCPHCRAFITTDDRVCPYCDAVVGPRAIDRREPGAIAGFLPHARFTTSMILLLNFGLYVATALYSMQHNLGGGFQDLDTRTLVFFGAKFRPLISMGQYWRLVTAGFLHGGLIHILMNSWVMYDLGTQVEEVFGTRRYLTIYFVATVTGFGASTIFSAGTSVGASAGLFGCIGAMIAYGTLVRSSMGQAIRSHYVRWAMYGLAMGLLPGFRIDNAAHIGGLAGGLAIAWIAGLPRLPDSAREKVWLAVAWICIALTAYSFYQAIRFLPLAQRLLS
jgi:rhomboid protease GluP